MVPLSEPTMTACRRTLVDHIRSRTTYVKRFQAGMLIDWTLDFDGLLAYHKPKEVELAKRTTERYLRVGFYRDEISL